MATTCAPRDPYTWVVVGVRRGLLSVFTVALVACGGGQSGPAARVANVGPAGADTTDGPGIALNPPSTVGPSNRIGLTWQSPSSFTLFTVFVQRAAGQAFEAVDATVAGNSGQFARGAAWKLDFPTARVRVRGCNDANQCVDSNEQPLLDALLGGLAPLPTTGAASFSKVELSADGNTLAFWAPNAVFVFQRATNGQWTQEAVLEPSVPSGSFGAPGHALSGDGNTIIVGDQADSGPVGGIDAPECGVGGIGPEASGAIYVFSRDAQHNWSRQAFIKAAVPVANEGFGFNIATSHDGNRILVNGISRMYLFEREANQWRQAHIFEARPGFSMGSSVAMAISGDGLTIGVAAVTLPARIFAVHVYKSCACDDGWRFVADLRSAKALPVGPNEDQFGVALSFSGDGNILAAGAPDDPGDAGDNGTTMNFGSPHSGAVYVFAAAETGIWQRRAFLKARTAPRFDRLGRQISLSADGKVLSAFACGFAANANGLRRNHPADAIAGPETQNCAVGGSNYVFEEDGNGAWSHTAAAIVAPGEQSFGEAFTTAMSADAQTVASLVAISAGGRVVVY